MQLLWPSRCHRFLTRASWCIAIGKAAHLVTRLTPRVVAYTWVPLCLEKSPFRCIRSLRSLNRYPGPPDSAPAASRRPRWPFFASGRPHERWNWWRVSHPKDIGQSTKSTTSWLLGTFGDDYDENAGYWVNHGQASIVIKILGQFFAPTKPYKAM